MSSYPDPTKNLENDSPEANLLAKSPSDGVGTPSVFACPDCHGTLWEMQDGALLRFRCRVGHAFTAESLIEQFDIATENLLWAASRSLYEQSALDERLSAFPETNAAMLRERGARRRELADRIKQAITDYVEASNREGPEPRNHP